mgnify:CR=1 FL=1
MAEHSTIEWTDATWSPWEGCTKVSPACDHCYAEGMNRWLRKGENWGPGAPRRIYSEDHWAKPMKWQRDAPKFHTLHGRSRRVFPSVCDPFDNEAPGLQRERLWATIRATPALTWLLLTKRIGNAKSMLPADWGDGYPNVWLGATVVNQAEADRDVPKLLAAPARVRFLSIEPMLGPVDLRPMFEHRAEHHSDTGVHWVIAGGESGPGARPMHPDWARSLRDQCTAAGVPFMFKQHGEWIGIPDLRRLPGGGMPGFGDYDHCAYDYWHEAVRIGKKAAGRLLDGCTHDGFPEVR